jgi:lipopolysaccharide export system permease protein
VRRQDHTLFSVGYAQQHKIDRNSTILLVDRYILRALTGPASIALFVTVFALSMETMPRLVARISALGNGFYFVSQSLISLIPEYLGIAVPLAIYLASALAFRRLALSSELDVLAASGIGYIRMLRMPLIFAAAGCILSIGLSSFIQPAGERRLDALGYTATRGGFGVAFPEQVPNIIDKNTQLYFETSQGDRIDNVLIQHGTTFISARSASLARGPSGDMILDLRDGVMTGNVDNGMHSSHFTNLRWDVPFAPAYRAHWKPARDRLQRFDIRSLLNLTASHRTGLPQQMAIASASGRFATALFMLLLPVFGFCFGPPPKRSRSGLALGLGILLILIFWRGVALVEDDFASVAPVLHTVLLVGFGLLAWLLFRLERKHGSGTIEAMLMKLVDRMRRLVPTWPSTRRASDPQWPARNPKALLPPPCSQRFERDERPDRQAA